jgi:hypothetical protein
MALIIAYNIPAAVLGLFDASTTGCIVCVTSRASTSSSRAELEARCGEAK